MEEEKNGENKEKRNEFLKEAPARIRVAELLSLHALQTFPMSQALGSSAGLSYTSYLTPMSHSMGLMPQDIMSSSPCIIPGSPPISVSGGSSSNQKLMRTDKLEVTHPITASLRRDEDDG